MSKVVDIIGRGYSIKNYIPSNGDVFTINAMQFGYEQRFKKQPTKAFWMDDWEALAAAAPGWWAYLCKQKHEIISSAAHPDHDWVIRYPIEKYIQYLSVEFPHAKLDYINNTTVYALIAAICDEYDVIYLHGIDFAPDNSQRNGQRGCIEYWIGMCHAVGLNVVINSQSHLLDINPHHKSEDHFWPMYGYKNQPCVSEIIKEGFQDE